MPLLICVFLAYRTRCFKHPIRESMPCTSNKEPEKESDETNPQDAKKPTAQWWLKPNAIVNGKVPEQVVDSEE